MKQRNQYEEINDLGVGRRTRYEQKSILIRYTSDNYKVYASLSDSWKKDIVLLCITLHNLHY